MSQRGYREGELVWAKMRGHPHWPAKVVRAPKGQPRPQGKLWIFFYGTHEHAWMVTSDLYDYKENKEKYSLPKKIKGFAEAIWEIEEDPELIITLGKPPRKKKRQSSDKPTPSQTMTLSLHHSSTNEKRRYVTRQHKRSSDGIVAQITQKFAARMELKSPQTKETLSTSENNMLESDSGVIEDVKTDNKTNEVICDDVTTVTNDVITCELVEDKDDIIDNNESLSKQSSEEKVSTENEASDEVMAVTDNTQELLIKSDVTTDKQEVTTDNQEVTTDKQEIAADKQEVTTDNQEVTTDKQEIAADNQEVTTDKQEIAADKQEVTTDKQEIAADKQEVTTDKLADKEIENLPRYLIHKDMNSVEILMVMNYNLKASLSVQAVDIQEAISILKNLLSLEININDLYKVSDLVTTIRKVRRYYGNKTICSLADKVYRSLKGVFAKRSTQSLSKRRLMTTSHGAGRHAPNIKNTRLVAKPNSNKALSGQSSSTKDEDQTVPLLA